MKQVKKGTKQNLWLLIYTKANEEKKANENLQRQGFNTFLPLIAPNNKNSDFKSLVPVFPRYVFVEIALDSHNWTSIKSSYGVSSIVMFSDKLTFIPNSIIESIKDRLNEKNIYKENISEVDYKKGDSVSIKKGQFVGLDAIFIAKKSKDRVRLLLKLLNTSVIAEVTTSDIGNKKIVKRFKF
ncbi:hypothetical protein N9442_03650 [Gammaproteobacteria bacterium]|nr:hypothetical protein [Gammaproteobacteria bacterium]